jgi:transglutaminase-like putative cysteine protease
MNNPNDFLKTGKQTEITEEVKSVATLIKGEGLDFIFNLLKWLDTNLEKRRFDGNVFRKRTADQIIKDKYSTGCTDTALAFVALCRAREIPASYLETIDARWFETKPEQIVGHVFSKVYLNNSWLLVDPLNGAIHIKSEPNKKQWFVLGEGLDSWDLGIHSYEDLKIKLSSVSEQC